jgi:endo-1,4-beta-xylanase
MAVALDALHGLIKGDWWLPPTRMVTDAAGALRFNGLFGEYVVSGDGLEASFRLEMAGASVVDVRLGEEPSPPG